MDSRGPRALISDVIPVQTRVLIPGRRRDVVEHVAIMIHPLIIPIVEVSEHPIWRWEREMILDVRSELALVGTVDQVVHEGGIETEDAAPLCGISWQSGVDLQVAAANGCRVQRNTSKVVIADVACIDELFVSVWRNILSRGLRLPHRQYTQRRRLHSFLRRDTLAIPPYRRA